MSSRRFYLACATIAAAAIGSIAWAEYAEAQAAPPCGPTEKLVASLKEKYNEVEVGGGLINEQHVIVAFASPDGATWTLLQVGANGISCVVQVGEHWFIGALPKAPVEGERPA